MTKNFVRELTMKVISRHFLYIFRHGYNISTGKNDAKCQPCGITRRFKFAPYELVEAIEKRLIVQLEEETTSSTLKEAAEVIEKLEQLGRVAVHNWIDSETDLVESLRTRSYYIDNYHRFCK